MNERITRPVLLVVDDEPENLALLERTFGFDYDVHIAPNGEEALKMLPNIPDLAVIITDQKMPGMTGTELLTEARVRRADAVRIILTGYLGPDDLIDAINSSHVYRYLTKPWDVEQLCLAVQHAVRLYEMGGGALVDEVTGLPNRGLLRRELEREMARSARTGRPLSALAATIRGYTPYLSASGQAAAERLMVGLSTEIGRLLRSIDTLGVYSDGIFLAILPECPDGKPVSERLRAAAALEDLLRSARVAVKEIELHVTTVRYKGDAVTTADLIRGLELEFRGA